MSIEVEFGEMDTAARYREEFPDQICPIDDDARSKTVHFVSDAPDHVIDQAKAEAAEGRGDRADTAGQEPLTDGESDRIDFSQPKANVPHAQSVKAIAQKHGVGDWLAYYDGTLTVDEHRQVMEEAGSEGGGARDDSHEDRRAARARDAARAQQSGECDHARGYCVSGDPDACEFLQDRCGFDREKVDRLLTEREPERRPDPEDREPELTGEEKGALARSWNGYKGAVADLEQAIDVTAEAWEDAQQAADAINGVRKGVGQDPLHFERLEEMQAEMVDLMRDAAADCHECHADHTGHSHEGDVPDREDIIEVDDAAQGTLDGGTADREQQARLARSEETRRQQRRAEDRQQQDRVEAERNPDGLMADTRGDADRGAETEEQDTDQQQFSDPEQRSL